MLRRWSRSRDSGEAPPSPVSTTSSWNLPAVDVQAAFLAPTEPEQKPETLNRGERLIMHLADGLLHHHYKRLQAKAIQDLWSSWARLRNKLSAHAWEPLRPIYGMKGHQKNPAPGPAARGRVPQ
jgi:hypothetical protein